MLRAVAPTITIAAALWALLAAPPARADMTLEQFRNYSAMPGGSTLVRSYLSGLRDGMIGLQANLAEQNIEPTFCPDGNELRTGTTFEETVYRELDDPSSGEPWAADTQMSTVVAVALQQAYPCRTY